VLTPILMLNVIAAIADLMSSHSDAVNGCVQPAMFNSKHEYNTIQYNIITSGSKSM